MKFLNILILTIPLTFFATEDIYEEGDSFKSAEEFIEYAAVDSRDIYKIRRGDTFVLTESFKDGDIFQVTLTSKKTNNEKYFILSKDLKDNSLTQLEIGT